MFKDLAKDLEHHNLIAETLSNAPSSMYGQTTSAAGTNTSHQSWDYSSSHIHLPRYFPPAPEGIPLDDLTLLAARGVFKLPESQLQNELLRKYAEYVHPLLPLLDLEELLKAVFSGEEQYRVSLMLFYAIMSAGAAFVDLQVIRAAGFPDRKVARKVFFQRAKVSSVAKPIRVAVS